MKDLIKQTDDFKITLPRKKGKTQQIKERKIKKRNGSIVDWDSNKIIRALALAFFDFKYSGAHNMHRDDLSKYYGLTSNEYSHVISISKKVSRMVELLYQKRQIPTIEDIQDIIEKALAADGEWDIARRYMLYRERKNEIRISNFSKNGLSEYIAVAKYARYRLDLKRRETFDEAASRVENMHLEKFATCDEELKNDIQTAFKAVKQKEVLPAMRSLQFGGEAVTAANARMFNCAFSPIDRFSFFREYMYLLLAGCGCGFSVQKHHIEKLQAFPKRKPEMELTVQHFKIPDTIEGWSDSIDMLFDSYLNNYKVEFNYSAIRARGLPLKTSGGKAPGHLPLKKAHILIEKILEKISERSIKSIEVYDICMYIAQSVLSGGIRRSATICLFSADDQEMMTAKIGNWFETNPQRSASNNSAVINRRTGKYEDFKKLFDKQKEFGEPGFYFVNNEDYGCNPCCEIGLNPYVKGQLSDNDKQHLLSLGYKGNLDEEICLSGWQMCNLTTINGAIVQTPEDFYKACENAAIIGTLQASYTNIEYLEPVSRFLLEREALLGVSICGILDNPDLLLNAKVLSTGAQICQETNVKIANKIGIRPAARITCIKPEGTASLLLNTGSGIHPHHAKRYFRRVQANRYEPVYQHFAKENPHMTEPSVYQPDTDDVITFPVQAPETAILRNEITAIEFLEYVKFVQKHWVCSGQAYDTYSPNLHHNVSNTCTVKPEEWNEVCEFIWQNRRWFTGISLLSYSGDKIYMQAPREEVITEDDINKWNRLKYHSVDYTLLIEKEDKTSLKEIIACSGNKCEL